MIVMHVFENHYYHYVIIMMKMMYVYSRFDAVRSGENDASIQNGGSTLQSI